MIDRTFFAKATMTLLIGSLCGCGKAPDQTGKTAPQTTKAQQLKQPLFDRFIPEFPYHLRSISEKKRERGTEYVAMLEARSGDHTTLLKSIDHSMKLNSYRLQSRKGKETVVSDYRSRNGNQVTVRVGPIDPHYAYQIPGATAMVRIAWQGDGMQPVKTSR